MPADSAANGNYVEFNRGDGWIPAYKEGCFTTLRSYKPGHFVVFNSVLPPALMVAYMAEVLYPDLVGT